MVDLDLRADRYYWFGAKYSGLASFLSAVGGTLVSGSAAAPMTAVFRFPWTDNQCTIRAEALSSNISATTRILYQIYAASSANAAFCYRNSSSSGITLQVSVGNTAYSQKTSGAIGDGKYIVTAQSMAPSEFFTAINGIDGSYTAPASSSLPAVTQVIVGARYDGTGAWSVPVHRFTLYPDPLASQAAAEALSTPTYDLWLEGDSYVGGAGGVSVGHTLGALGWRCYNSAIGGSPLGVGTNNIKDRVLAQVAAMPALAALPMVLWDGDNNAFGTTVDDLGFITTIRGVLTDTSKFIYIPTNRRTPQGTDQRVAIDDLKAAVASAFGASTVIECQPALAALSTGDTADLAALALDCCPPSALADGVHLTTPGMNAVITPVSAAMASRGWRKAA